jgi:hypothetical protein
MKIKNKGSKNKIDFPISSFSFFLSLEMLSLEDLGRKTIVIPPKA